MGALSYTEQTALLDRCVQRDLRLADELERLGRTYDDLRYVTDGRTFPSTSAPPDATRRRRPSAGIPAVSFFSGCGGLDLGLEAAGFTHLALVENNRLFCDTLRLNRPGWNVIGPPLHRGDVSDIEAMIEALTKLGLSAPFEGLFCGGPPCQPFSIAANQRFAKSGPDFKRIGYAHRLHGNLLFDFLQLVTHFRPRVFLVENVPGLATIDEGEPLREALQEMAGVGYQVHGPCVLDAADFGVPQRRQRLLLVGCRTPGQFSFPQPTGPPTPCGEPLSTPLDGVPNHVTRQHSAESVRRYMMLAYGRRDKLGRVDRLDPALPSKTVIAGGTNGGGRSHLHPLIPRTLSVRECARLQTFPDDFLFLGPSARQFTQVGNAVPPRLAAQVGEAIRRQCF